MSRNAIAPKKRRRAETPTQSVGPASPTKSRDHRPATKTSQDHPRPSVIVVGLGNIGSSLADHLGRMGLGKITLLDPGHFEAKNVLGQMIDRQAIGKSKVDVIAAKLRRVDPTLEIQAIQAKVQDVPLGVLRASVLLSCLDSRLARAYVNQAARWLGLDWIDAGVEPSQLLARVNVYRAMKNSPCAQCSWSENDYAVMEVPYPCRPDDGAASTNAPSALGALAASLQALELQKALRGDWNQTAVGREVIICAAAHKLFSTSISVNPQCRCSHERWEIRPLRVSPSEFTLGRALKLGRHLKAAGSVTLSVPTKSFVRSLACPACGEQVNGLLRVEGRLTASQRVCRRCGVDRVPIGFDQIERIDSAQLAPLPKNSRSEQTLASIGVGHQDIILIERGKKKCAYEIQHDRM